MVHIPQFRERWALYIPLAALSPYFRGIERVTQDAVAQRIPRDPLARLPASAEDHIAGAAFGAWLATEVLPDNRVAQWEELTRIPVAIWTAADPAAFMRALRQQTGEVLGWQGFVQARGKRGIRVHAMDRQAKKFIPEGAMPAEPPELQLVWPDCVARIEVPAPAPKAEPEDRRAWMFTDYGRSIYTLDPLVPASGEPPPTRLDAKGWKPERGGHVLLPRGVPGYVYLPPNTALGTRFDLLVLVTNLASEPDDIRTLFDDFEQRLRVRASEVAGAPYQKTVRTVLDEAASLIDDKDIAHKLYRQTCEVVSREEAIGAA